MRRTSTISPPDFGLTPGAERVRKIRPRTGRLTMPGWFPTRKGTQPMLRVESTLEIDGLAQFEINPDCVLMATQPHHLRFAEPQRDGTHVWRRYTPDLAIRMADGAIAVLDFKIAKYAKAGSWEVRERVLKQAYLRDHGIVFRTVTEEAIKVEPRRSNAAIMLMHRRIVPDPDADVALAALIRRDGLPTTIGDLSGGLSLPSTLPDVDRAFTAIVELALRGGIALDLGVPLGPETVVSARRPMAPRR